MRLYEFEAKKVLAEAGIPVPRCFGVIQSADELEKNSLPYPVVLKAQVLVGGRGKAGGVKIAVNATEAKTEAEEILSLSIKSYPVQRLLMEEALDEKAACYAGITMDPGTYENVILLSAAGGVDIEETARLHPDAILKVTVPGQPDTLPEHILSKIESFATDKLGAAGVPTQNLPKIINQLYNVYLKSDARLVEINPLMATESGAWYAADAKIVLDDNALFRQGKLLETLGVLSGRHDVAEPTLRERKAMKWAFPYVDLLPEDAVKNRKNLYVGLVPGGAGYGIFSIDEVMNIGNRYFGGSIVPVNFMDSGGGPSQQKVAAMFDLLMDYPLVDIIITSRFGGISSCDVFIRGLIQCLRSRKRTCERVIPVIGRMVGTDLPKARDYLEKALQETPDELSDLDLVVGNRIIMAEVIRQGINRVLENRVLNTDTDEERGGNNG